MKYRLIAIGLLFCGTVSTITSQNIHKNVYPYSLYETGKEMFREKIYGGSIRALEEFIRESDDEQLIEEARFFIVYAGAELNQEDAEEKIEAYMKRYPVSVHTNRLRFLLASSYYKKKAYAEAIHWFDQTKLEQLSDEEQDLFFYRLGYAYLQQKEYDIAGNLFKGLQQNSARYRQDATYYLAYVDYCKQHYDSALKGFEQVKDVEKYSEEVPFYMAQIYFLQKKYGAVVAEGKKLLKRFPDHANKEELYRIIGSSSYYLEDYEAAIDHLSIYKKMVETPLASDMYLLGMAYYSMKDYAQALENLSLSVGASDEAAVKSSPVTQSTYLHIGQCALKLGDKNKARIAFESASRSDANLQIKEQAMYNYGLIIHETSFSPFNESLVVFERFLNLFPQSNYADKVNDYLVDTYLTTRNYEAALASIGKIKQPGSKILGAKQNILFQLGAQDFANSDFVAAIKRFDESLAVGNYYQEVRSECYFWKGESYYRLQDYKQAVNNFRQFFASNSDTNSDYYHLAHYNLAYSYMKQQQIPEALSWFNKYVSFSSEQQKNTYSDALNRIGDCYYYQRDWQTADDYYARALSNQPASGDYSIYQRAFVMGLKKQYNEKIAQLNGLIEKYPQSEYVDDAYYEIGRSYVMLGKDNEAIRVFTDLMNKFPESALSRKSGNQVGLLYFNSNHLNESIEAYKRVVSRYPGSDEAYIAMEDLKNVYVELDKVHEYADFVRSVDGNARFNASAQDSLTYLAAEKLFLRGDMNKAKQSLENYLQSFPDGAFSLNAHFYLGNIHRDQKRNDEALNEYSKVLERGDSKFLEEALVHCADITYKQKKYEAALEYFNRLLLKAEKKENKDASKVGILRCAYVLKKHQDAILAANVLVEDDKIAPEIRQEAYYVRAKSYLATQQAPKAAADLRKIIGETRTVYGAEANYLLAKIEFDAQELDKAEKTIFQFIERTTPHQYWMARCFILLSDLYVKKGDNFQAKEYLVSLKENYKGSDDIAQMIEERLSKLNTEVKTETNTEQ